MKATELRIGNVLTFLDKQVAVVAITETHASIKGYELNRYTPVALDYTGLQRIPLTEEILLKCGFDFSQFKKPMQTCGVDLFYGHDYYFKRIGYKTDLILRSLNGVFRIECFYSTRIQYLHQLQNLYFALTGKELEVKL
ncbi:hypothetical protein [Sphingobacterium spiritivorum]|uniref:hypothetical protein n=1 Tax=Sphingobacterium spiritivorum TaxID=258 RepID=UPI003DA39346